MDVIIKELDGENLADLIPLYREVFGKRTDLAYLKAKYDTGYLGTPFFGHLAYDDNGRPVAFHGAVPFMLESRGRTVIGAQYGDAMTLRDFAGHGLFTRLGQLTDARLQDFGIRFIYGFPNQNSEYGYLNKLDWKGVHRMRGFTIPVITVPLEKFSRTVAAGAMFQRRIKKKLEGYLRPDHVLANSALEGESLASRRNAEFYAYKGFTNNFVMELAGIKLWVKPEGGLLIGDMERRPEPEILAAINELKTIARSNGIAKITFQASPGTYLETIFSRHFNAFDSWLLGGKSFTSDFSIESLRCTYGDLDTF